MPPVRARRVAPDEVGAPREDLELVRVPADAAEVEAARGQHDRAHDAVVAAIVRRHLREAPVADGLGEFKPVPDRVVFAAH